MGASTPEQVAVVKAAVAERGNELFDAARREGRREPRDAYLMDALAQICREWLDGLRPGHDVDDDDEDAPARPKARTPRSAWLGLLRIDIEALQRGRAEGAELCEITGAGTVPVAVARSLLGESILKLVITRGVDVVNVTHLGRGPTVAQKVALLWTSPGCCVAGCGRMAGIEHDHTIAFADSRHTVLDELRRVCDHHHDLKTVNGWDFIQTDDDSIHCVAPDDPRHPRHAAARAGPRAGPDPPDAEAPEPPLIEHDAA